MILNNVMVNKPKKNNFDLSHEVKLTGKGGYIYPCFKMDVIPGDSFQVNTESLVRLAPMLAPIMHRIDLKIDYFFTPNRLLWSEWEDFITGGQDGTELPSFPRYTLNTSYYSTYYSKGTLYDYFGLPVMAGTKNQEISALPFRAYQKIYNEYYRDQNVIDEVTETDGSGIQSDYANTLILRKRAWEKDYFTSALPWPQKGTAVEIPLSITEDSITYKTAASATNGVSAGSPTNLQVGTDYNLEYGGNEAKIQNIESIDASEITINELRRATKLQRWLERAARTGSRYIEQIYSHFGVRSSDARLQRPEYLGGGKVPVMISEVVSTYTDPATGDNPQGDMTGHGISVASGIGFKRSFEEHGIIIGLLTILPRTQYSQGLDRHMFKFDKFDYFWPDFANLGEQEILNKEILLNSTNIDETFGYQQRYAEYKYKDSYICGDFRDTLDFWHQSRLFTQGGSAPTLSQEFLESDIDDRIFAVQDGTDYLWIQLFHKVRALRPIPLFSIPELA